MRALRRFAPCSAFLIAVALGTPNKAVAAPLTPGGWIQIEQGQVILSIRVDRTGPLLNVHAKVKSYKTHPWIHKIDLEDPYGHRFATHVASSDVPQDTPAVADPAKLETLEDVVRTTTHHTERAVRFVAQPAWHGLRGRPQPGHDNNVRHVFTLHPAEISLRGWNVTVWVKDRQLPQWGMPIRVRLADRGQLGAEELGVTRSAR